MKSRTMKVVGGRGLGTALVAWGLLAGMPQAHAKLVLTGWDPIVQIGKATFNITVDASDLSQVSSITYLVHVPVGTDRTTVKYTKPPAPVQENLTFAYDQQANQFSVDTTALAPGGGSTSVDVYVVSHDAIVAHVAGATGATLTTSPVSLDSAKDSKPGDSAKPPKSGD